MAIKVVVPFKNFEGFRGGVQFRKGVGIFEDEAVGRRIAEQFGYEIVEDEKPKADVKVNEKEAGKEPVEGEVKRGGRRKVE